MTKPITVVKLDDVPAELKSIPIEGREIGEHAMRPYKISITKPNGKVRTFESL